MILTNPPVIKGQPVSQLGRPVGSIVTFTVNVGPYPQGYYYQWLFGSTPLTNLEGGNIFITNNVLTINPALMSDEGSYSVIVSNGFNSIDYGVKTSAVVRLTIVPDHTRPTVTITSPPANSRTNTLNTLIIEGTATDNAQVTNVMYWFTNFNAGLNPGYECRLRLCHADHQWRHQPQWPQHKALVHHQPCRCRARIFWPCKAWIIPATFQPLLTRRFFYQVPSSFYPDHREQRRRRHGDQPRLHQR